MLNKQGFDLWANDYDLTVQLSEEQDSYPFAGYKSVLNTIFNEIMQKKNSTILDIGFGTGVITNKLYEKGHIISGMDFSSEMIRIAQSKMPAAHLVEGDFSKGLSDCFNGKTFDAIISTYALHHLSDEEKVSLIKSLLLNLTDKGKIYIGDIAFQNREQLEECRQRNLSHWDDDEFYFVYDELNSLLTGICHFEFYPLSHCGGVLIISNIYER